MAKTPDLEKIQNQVKKLELHQLLLLQKTVVETIASQEAEAEETIAKANAVLETIRKGGE